MDRELLANLGTYSEVYEYVAKGSRTKEELFRYLQEECGKPRTTADGQVKKAFDGQLQMIISDGEKVTFDKDAAYEIVAELCDWFGLDVVTKSTVRNPKDTIAELWQEIQILKRELKRASQKPVAKAIITQMDKKTIIPESAKVYIDGKYVEDAEKPVSKMQLDVKEMLSLYGGERDTLYRIIDGDQNDLTVENYTHKIRGEVLGSKFLKFYLEQVNRIKQIGKRKIYEGKTVTQLELHEKRLEAINRLLKDNTITNQQKLSMYALFHHPYEEDMEFLLRLAGDYGVEAEHVIWMFENKNLDWTYHTAKNFLMLVGKTSEIRMKRQAAVELIAGDWYVTAKYNGKDCHFQMVPMEELEKFRKYLLDAKYDEATETLCHMLDTKRNAFCEKDDFAKEIIVTDVTDDTKH